MHVKMAFGCTFRNPKEAVSLMGPKIKHGSQFLNACRLPALQYRKHKCNPVSCMVTRTSVVKYLHSVWHTVYTERNEWKTKVAHRKQRREEKRRQQKKKTSRPTSSNPGDDIVSFSDGQRTNPFTGTLHEHKATGSSVHTALEPFYSVATSPPSSMN